MIPSGNVGFCVNSFLLVFGGHFPIFIRHLLINRTFRVRVGDTLSPSFDEVEGVPQGSVLSVLCFAIAINDIVTAVPDGVSCSLYVDDLVLYLSGSILTFAVRRMQLTINRVANWTDSQGSRFSVEKSHSVLFRRSRRVVPYQTVFPYDVIHCIPSNTSCTRSRHHFIETNRL